MMKNKSTKVKNLFMNAGISLIPAILVLLLVVFEPFYSLDAFVTDLVYSQLGGIGDDIKIICVDEETLAQYGEFTEWSREKSADLLEYLYSDPENAPSVTAFDFMFVGDKDTDIDNRFAKAAEGNNVVFASNLVYRGKVKYNSDGSPYYDSTNIEMEELQYDSLRKVVDSGFANADISKDGFVRNATLYTNVDGNKRYSFAAQIYLNYCDSLGHLERAQKLIDLRKQVRFFYSGKPGEIAHFSMKDVLDGTIPTYAFKDSIVMVGAYAPGMQDSYHNAADRSKEMYGVEIHANIVKALMNGKTASKFPVWILAIIASVIIFVYTYFARKMKMYPAIYVGMALFLLNLLMGRILAGSGRIISLVYVAIVLIAIMICIIIEKYVIEAVKKKKVINTFKKYMAPQVIDKLIKDDDFHINLGGQKRDVAVLFVDIRGFTSMSEKLSPEEVVSILNQYLTLTSDCVFDHGGMLDKFIGDCTMAIFNALGDQEDYIYQAVLTGLDMQARSKELSERLNAQYGRTVQFGVGIHIGEAVVGNIGSTKRMDFTAIGDTVNTASRIESNSLAGEMLISEDVLKALEGRIVVEFKEAMKLKGKDQPVNVYNVTGVK